MTITETIPCPLCSASAAHYHDDKSRAYFQCSHCRLVFVQPESFLSPQEEKTVYELHRNAPDDAGYRRFLSRMLVPMVNRLAIGSRGLDFGCGPGPTLSLMFEERGYPMAIYDPIFAANESVLETEYDFVTATEVAEHLRRPKDGLNRMWRCVRPGGYLGIMSKRVIDRQAFANWHYKNDETHVCFFSEETFHWLARQWQTDPVFEGKDVVFFQKGMSTSAASDGKHAEQSPAGEVLKAAP